MVYEDVMNLEDRKKTINLINLMIGNLLKHNDFVERSLSMGCHQLSDILSGGANNVVLCPFLQNKSFTEFFGFEETEVKSILRKAGRDEYFNDVKKMYDGYMAKSSDGRDIEIYSPWTILRYLFYEKLDAY
ncbi:hypothetical protein PV325_012217 [Microctonus aethiopoides]|nr:hypothetical protein PV325_012217 [Microctonus aethiopoides]